MECNYNSFIIIMNFYGLFRNALRCRKSGACRNTGALTVTLNCGSPVSFEILQIFCIPFLRHLMQ